MKLIVATLLWCVVLLPASYASSDTLHFGFKFGVRLMNAQLYIHDVQRLNWPVYPNGLIVVCPIKHTKNQLAFRAQNNYTIFPNSSNQNGDWSFGEVWLVDAYNISAGMHRIIAGNDVVKLLVLAEASLRLGAESFVLMDFGNELLVDDASYRDVGISIGTSLTVSHVNRYVLEPQFRFTYLPYINYEGYKSSQPPFEVAKPSRVMMSFGVNVGLNFLRS